MLQSFLRDHRLGFTFSPSSFALLLCSLLVLSCTVKRNASQHPQGQIAADTSILQLADPTIFLHNGFYYLYGTGGNVNNGFMVYTSADLKKWKGPAGASAGYALVQGDSYGTKGFWAPQVFHRNNIFYMAYTANENIAIAQSTSPLGPFKQQVLQTISGPGKQIDPYVFFDDDGKAYLYHVRLTNGNRLYVAELNESLTDIVSGTEKFCLAATDQAWENTENTKWPVAEGPTVLKHNGLYYLFYSANDFRNKDYAVGFAVSNSPMGPWQKFTGNPIISRQNIGINGTGHGDFFRDKKGNLQYVLHTHKTTTVVSPRLTAIVKGKFVPDKSKPDKFVIDNKSFRYVKLTPK